MVTTEQSNEQGGVEWVSVPPASDPVYAEPYSDDGLYAAGETYAEDEWAYSSDLEREPVGLAGTRGRAIALTTSLLALVAIFAAVAWLLSARAANERSLSAITAGTGGASLEAAPRVGALAPDFTLIDVHSNQPVKLSSLRGKPVFMNFWGTWCPPCRAEMPEMQKLHNKYKDQIQIVGVTMGPRDEPNGVKAFVDAAKYDWSFIHDTDYSVATTYEVQAIPSSYFIDKDGVIKAVQIGGMNEGQMEHYVEQVK